MRTGKFRVTKCFISIIQNCDIVKNTLHSAKRIKVIKSVHAQKRICKSGFQNTPLLHAANELCQSPLFVHISCQLRKHSFFTAHLISIVVHRVFKERDQTSARNVNNFILNKKTKFTQHIAIVPIRK